MKHLAVGLLVTAAFFIAGIAANGRNALPGLPPFDCDKSPCAECTASDPPGSCPSPGHQLKVKAAAAPKAERLK